MDGASQNVAEDSRMIILAMIAGPNVTFQEMIPETALRSREDQLIHDAAKEQDAI